MEVRCARCISNRTVANDVLMSAFHPIAGVRLVDQKKCMISGPALQLCPITGDEDIEQLSAELAPGFNGDEASPREMLCLTHAMLKREPRPEPWGAYIAWQDETAVGTCAFKFPPDADRVVEIAYMTFPVFEGRGHATAMVAALTEIAFRAGAEVAIAHTLPEENASNAALKRNGFGFDQEFVDPEDGPVWRWSKRA